MRRLLLLSAVLVAALAGAAATALARTGPCLPGGGGPRCHVWYGKEVSINDGDTIDVDIDGDGTHRPRTVRWTAIQAMEQTRYSQIASRRRGQCNAVEATARLEQLLKAGHHRVRLSAEDPASRADVRLKRSVAVRIGGRWVDTGLQLIREGHALFMPTTTEGAWNARYLLAQQQAMQDHRFLWDPQFCGAGPDQDVPLRVLVDWDPIGVDVSSPDDEWVKVQNLGHRTISLARWWLRDSMLRRFTFPAGTTVAPGDVVTVHVRRGADAPGVLHWGLAQPIFENGGDGAYLFDPHGDLRASMVYPCLVACTDPLQGRLHVSANPRRPESMRVRNDGDTAADLFGYALGTSGSHYVFEHHTVLAPGQTLQLDVGGNPADDTPTHLHWGQGRFLMPDPGGTARLETLSEVTIDCTAWGSGRC